MHGNLSSYFNHSVIRFEINIYPIHNYNNIIEISIIWVLSEVMILILKKVLLLISNQFIFIL